MKRKQLIGAALATALALTPAALAAEQGQRIVTTQNGTGYTVSSVGRHVVAADDSSRTFAFAPTNGYDLAQLVITDGAFTDRADVSTLDPDLTMHGVTYPIHYESKTDAHGTSVIRATVSVPAAADDITLTAEAVSMEYTVTATAQSGAVVSSGTAVLPKGAAYTITARPDGNLHHIASAVLTVGQNKSTVILSRGCDEVSQGYRFRMDADGVLTVYCGSVTDTARIELQTAMREPDSGEVLITVRTGRGISSEVTRDIVKKGTDYTVSFSADRGYAIDALTLEAGGKTAYSTPNTNTVFVGKNAYRVTGNDAACTVYLTDLQDNIIIGAESTYDSDHLPIHTSAGTGVRISKDCGDSVRAGEDAVFTVAVTDAARYALDEITLRIGDSSRTVSAGETAIRIGGAAYKLETGTDGRVQLYVRDIDQPVSVSATAKRVDASHRVTMQQASHLTITKDVSGGTVKHGSAVTFTVKPETGYAVDTVTLTVGSQSATASAGARTIVVGGVAYDVERGSTGAVKVYVDDVRASVTISATAAKAAPGNGSNGLLRIDRTVKAPLLVGYAGMFAPDKTMSRAEAVQLLARMSGAAGSYAAPGFADVQSTAYYADALGALVAGGVVDANAAYFHPDAPITRAEVAEMLYRLDTTAAYSAVARFYDVPAAALYAPAVAYCADRGWMGGYPDGTFRPHDAITRAEMAAVAVRVMGRTAASGKLTVSYTDVPGSHWAYNEIRLASAYQW